MKKTLVLLSLAVAASAFSQGTVNFLTRDTVNGVNALIVYTNSGTKTVPLGVIGPVANGTKPGTNIIIEIAPNSWGNYARAGLYGGPNGSARDALVLLVPCVGFRTGAASGYVNPGSDAMRTVFNVPGGAMATLQVRGWDCGVSVSSYEEAVALSQQRYVYLGESPLLNNIVLGNYIPPGGTPTPPAALTGLVGFGIDYVGVPEPSVIGLGILGAVAGLLVFRRRN